MSIAHHDNRTVFQNILCSPGGLVGHNVEHTALGDEAASTVVAG